MVSKRGCLGWFQKRTNMEKTLLSLSSLLLLTLFLMILVGIAFHGSQGDDHSDDDEMCWSSDCLKAAGDMLSSMESSIDTCSDFYNFACGNYGREPGQTASVSRRSTESVFFLLKNILESDDPLDINGLLDVKNFYNSCVQFGSYHHDVEETRESLLKLMTEMGIGVWPIIDSLYDTSTFSLERTLTNLVLLDVPVVFKMEIVPDERLTNSYLIKISPGNPRESGRRPEDIRNDVHLRRSVLTSFLLLGASSTASTDLKDIIAVDSSFAAIQQEKSTPCDDVTLLAPQEAISELNRFIPEIKWDIVVSEIRKVTGLQRSFAVKLHCKQRIRDFVVSLNDLSVRSETNYLGWRFFSKFVEHVIPTFEKSHFGIGEAVPRWRVCLELMEKFTSPVLSDVLTHKMINKEIKENVESISKSTLSTTQHLISSASWLSDPLKSRIREQVSKIRIRYPFQRQNLNGGLSLRIPQVEVSNFTAVVIQRQRQWMIENFKRLSQDTEAQDAFEAWTPVLSARSDSLSRDSTAYIYFDKITSPYIRRHGSEWLHFGGFGISFAREISRVLMSMNGGRGDREGSKLWKIWWQHSRNSSTCLDKSLSSWLRNGEEPLQIGETEKLLQDIFLDRSSLQIAYETAAAFGSSKYSSLPGLDFSKEKIFFLGYAQTLCDADPSSRSARNIPVKDRLNAVLYHFETFNELFGCENPSSQCLVWA